MKATANPLDFDGLRPESPVMTTVHHEWRQKLRQFVDTHITPNIDDWNAGGTFPDALYAQAAEAGILGMGFPEEAGGVAGTDDLFHRIIFAEEFHRLGSGVVFADLACHWIGLPPVIQAGAPELIDAVARPVLAGERKIAFAVTEPSGGSDVSRIQTTATPSDDGWQVSGTKTLISGCMRADHALVAVRTSSEGTRGISLLLIDMDAEGVSREPVPGLQWYNASLGTIHFDSVHVPATRLIGQENAGFRALTGQFNIERFSGVAATLAMGRTCVADAIAFAQERETFGKRLIDHQVIRHKLVDQVRSLQAAYALLDHCVWQFERGKISPAQLSMLKVQATTTLEACAREAMHILGGKAYAQSARAERILRESRIFALGGGTEEVLRDLAGRQLGF